MKTPVLAILLLLSVVTLRSQGIQEPEEGTVSYLSSQNVYVQFRTTASISAGDTLYIRQGDQLIPALKVTALSSISCVCVPISDMKPVISDKIYHQQKQTRILPPIAEKTIHQPTSKPLEQLTDSTAPVTVEKKKNSQLINGYFSIASYSNFSNSPSDFLQRMKYTLSLNVRNMGNSNLSFESYLSFVQTNKNWDEIKRNIFNGLKIYNLSLAYDFSSHYKLLIGRKINPLISNMGAVDGLQFEVRYRPITVGILAGFRPNYSDYSFDLNLFQFGGFVSHEQRIKNGFFQTTLAFIQQTNSGKTDRRFAYLQHSNSVIKNLTFFGSLEVDLFRLVPDSVDSTYTKSSAPKLSNLYVSLSYQAFKKLTLSISYSARQNVIYYETNKNYLDKLLDPQTLQGYLFSVNYRPVKKLSIGASAGYRFEKKDPKPSMNINGFITYDQIPWLGISASFSFTWLETSYLNGKIYSLGISRDLVSGKLFAGLTYRYVDYDFSNFESTLTQNIGEVNLTWRIYRKLAFSVYYEGTFEKLNTFNRIYSQLSMGF